MIDSNVIEAFQLMWGNFPYPAMLIHKSRKMVAINVASQKLGRVEGTMCVSYGGPETHKGCKANQVLASQQPAFLKRKNGERESIAYWLPLDGYPDFYIHFIVVIND